MSESISKQEIIKGIKNSDNRIMRHIYRSYFPRISAFIIKNSGKKEDAEDVFQEALISIFRRLKAGDLEIEHGFYTYLYAICSRLWYKKTKRKDFNVTSVDDVPLSTTEEELVTKVIERTETYRLFQSKLLQMGKDCQQVLGLHFVKKSFKEIAETMNFASEEYARRKKYLCKKELTKLITADVRYRELAS